MKKFGFEKRNYVYGSLPSMEGVLMPDGKIEIKRILT